VHQTLGQQVPQHDMSSAQRTVIERASLPTKDFTNGLETNVRRTRPASTFIAGHATAKEGFNAEKEVSW
jgi:hypothetical protein